MAMIRRVVLFCLVNVLVIFTISTVIQILGINPYLQRSGYDLPSLAGFCLIWGMGGSLISLALSKPMAKWAMGVRLIDPQSPDARLRHLTETVRRLAASAGLPACPEIGVYDSHDMNAFATGISARYAMVAVSSGMLQRMRTHEIEGVIGHEISHIANGDMVTMTLLQGVVNAFAMFLSRVLAYAAASAMRSDRDDDGPRHSGWVWPIQMVLEIVFMVLGSVVVAWFSRYREYRADAGSARIAGRKSMVAALQRLSGETAEALPAGQATVQTLQINGHPKGLMALFASHPPLADRIRRLETTSANAAGLGDGCHV